MVEGDPSTDVQRMRRDVYGIGDDTERCPSVAPISMLFEFLREWKPVQSRAVFADPISSLEGTRLHLRALIALITGMRLGEILGLRWKDVDRSEGGHDRGPAGPGSDESRSCLQEPEDGQG